MRKILILNGAGKKNGNTAALIKSFREGAEAAGHEILTSRQYRDFKKFRRRET